MLHESLEQYLDEPTQETESESSAEQESLETSQDQPEGASSSEENEGDSLDSQLDSLELEEESSSDVLGLINELGLIRKGLPFEYDDVEKVKEHLQKGFDYTEKTQELAEQRKEFENDIATQKNEIQELRGQVESERQEMQEVLTEYQVIGELMAELQTNDPEFFNELDQSFKQKLSMRNQHNPVIDALKSEIGELKKGFQSKEQEQEIEKLNSIREGWEKELSEVQTSYGAKLRSLAVKPDWQKIHETWKNDSEGSMTVKQALLAVHGEGIQKALEAKSKLAQTKKKSQMRRGPEKTNETGIVRGHGSGTYMNKLEEIAAKHGI